LTLFAATLGVTGVRGHRITLFTVLMTAAWLVRPNLLPGLSLLWIGVAAGVRPFRRLLPGVLTGAAMVVVSVIMMAVAEGGWQAFFEAFTRHANKHFSRLGDAPAGWPGLGLVKGLGGSIWAAGLMALAVIGLWMWSRRRGRRAAVVWLVVLGVTVGQLVGLQNKTYTRYAVPVHLGMAPLIAGGAALAPVSVATGGLLVAAAVLALKSFPSVAEQHETELPGWSAVVFAAREAAARGSAVVIEPELHPFASYLWYMLERDGGLPPPLVLSPWAPEPWTGVHRPYLVATVHRQHYPPPLAGGEVAWAGVSERLRPLTQQRFLEAWVINNPPLPVSGWWPVERLANGEGFMWGGAESELVLPPLPQGVGVSLRVRPAPGAAPLEIEANGHGVAEIGGFEGPQWITIGPELCDERSTTRLLFVRAEGYPPGTEDARSLAVELFDVVLMGPGLGWGGPVATEQERAALGLRLDGHYRTEDFGPAGTGVWTESRSRMAVAAAPGHLVLTMSAPRPVPPETKLLIGGAVVAEGPGLTATPLEVVVEIAPSEAGGGEVLIEIESVPYVPALAGHGGDRRELGVVLHRVRFEPAQPVEWAEPFAAHQAKSNQ
jgi:hypothetical protein